MSRIRPWTNGDQVALDGSGNVPVVVDSTVPVDVLGPLTDTELRAAAVPVLGPLTDTELRATSVPVLGPLTDTELRATSVPVIGPLTDTELRATEVPISMADRDAYLYDANGIPVTAVVNADRTTNLDGLAGLLVNAMNFGRISDTVVKNFRLDASTEALMTVSYAHHETHAGSHFYYKDSYSIAKNGIVEHLVITPNTTKWAHMIFGIDAAGGQVDVEIFEGATVSANGTLETVVNRNRNSLSVSTTMAYHAPTVTTDGVRLSKQTLGINDKKSAGGGTRDSDEIMLKQNTIYLIRTTEQNVNPSEINVNFDWYEHTNRN